MWKNTTEWFHTNNVFKCLVSLQKQKFAGWLEFNDDFNTITVILRQCAAAARAKFTNCSIRFSNYSVLKRQQHSQKQEHPMCKNKN